MAALLRLEALIRDLAPSASDRLADRVADPSEHPDVRRAALRVLLARYPDTGAARRAREVALASGHAELAASARDPESAAGRLSVAPEAAGHGLWIAEAEGGELALEPAPKTEPET